MAQAPGALSKPDPALAPRSELAMQCQERQFPEGPAGVAAPRRPRVPRRGTGGVSTPPVAPAARAAPGLAPGAALAAWRRCAAGGQSPEP